MWAASEDTINGIGDIKLMRHIGNLSEHSEESEDVWLNKVYNNACTTFGECPPTVRAVRTAWPFFDPETTEDRGFAKFTMYDKIRPISALAGKELHLVIYTSEIEYENKDHVRYSVLRPNVLRIKFSSK